MKSRRNRSDSTEEAVRVMRDAHRPIVPPANVPLSQVDRAFFANIVEEAARADWTVHQLEIAALLARSMHDFAVEQALLRDEGSVVSGFKGMIPNPRKAVLQMHANNIISFRRTLCLDAAARGEKKEVGQRMASAVAIQAQSPLNDELLARA